MWQKLLRGIGCLFYLGLLAAAFAVISYASFSLFVRRGVTPVPELKGLSESDAQTLLSDQGLQLTWSPEDNRYDENIEAGKVLSQKPRSGNLVKRGSTVSVALSRGPQRIEVPSVTGRALQAAQVTLAAAGLTAGRTLTIYSDGGRDGTIARQRPEAGALLERGAAVDLFLIRRHSAETYIMPDLVKRQYEEVRRFFEGMGFRMGRVSYESYDGVEPGTVLRQFPLAGHPLDPGEVISLWIVAGDGTPQEILNP